MSLIVTKTVFFLYFITITTISLCSYCCLADEEFYSFDVGQGSCNLIIYSTKTNNIGFLFDAGSKNTKTLSKISQFKIENETAIFSAKENPQKKISNIKKIGLLDLEQALLQSPDISNELAKSMSFETSGKKGQLEVLSKIRDYIRKKIYDYNLFILFIFLSHPDEDHINLIAKKYKNNEEITSIIPNNVNKIEVFLGGDWVNHETEDTKTVIDYLKNRGANINFPYYWKYEGSLFSEQDSSLQYQPGVNKYLKLKEKILQGEGKLFLSHDKGPMFTSTKIINTYFKYSPTMLDIGKVLYDINPLKLDPSYKKTLESVYFRSFGAETSDINAQSLITSFKMPSLRAILTCTGDAESVTFSTVKEIDGLSFHEKKYLNAVVIPHHGAISNFSGNLISSLKPDLFFVSAGLTSYDHPNYQALSLYEKAIDSTSSFLDNYYRTSNEYLPLSMSIARTGKNIEDYKLNFFNKIPVLSTNLLGNISWHDSSIHVSYNNIIEKSGHKYLVDISKKLIPNEESLYFTKEKVNQIWKDFNEKFSSRLKDKLDNIGIETLQSQIHYFIHQKNNGTIVLYPAKEI